MPPRTWNGHAWKAATLAVIAGTGLSGCISARIGSGNRVRARPVAPIDVAAARAALAGYSVTEQRLTMADGVALYAATTT